MGSTRRGEREVYPHRAEANQLVVLKARCDGKLIQRALKSFMC